MYSDPIGNSASAAPGPSTGRPLQTAKSFAKLKFGKDKLKAPSSASTSPAWSQERPSINSSKDDGGEEISWHIQSASGGPRAPVSSDVLRDLVIVSTIGAYRMRSVASCHAHASRRTVHASRGWHNQ